MFVGHKLRRANKRPIDASYIGQSGNTDTTATITFSSEDLGEAAAGKMIVVAVTSLATSSGADLSSATIDGVSATIGRTRFWNTSGNYRTVALIHAVVDGSTTGDIVLTFASSRSGNVNTVISVYEIHHYKDEGVAQHVAPGGSDPSNTFATVNDNSVIIAASADVSSTLTCSWIGVNENFDIDHSGDSHSGGHLVLDTGEETDYEVTADWSGGTASGAVIGIWE